MSKNPMVHMKRRWGIQSTFRVCVVLAVFSLAGMSIVRVKSPLFHLIHFPRHAHWWVQVPLYILVMFPTYQVLLLIWAALLGQWSFFWQKEKRLGRWLMRVTRLGALLAPAENSA